MSMTNHDIRNVDNRRLAALLNFAMSEKTDGEERKDEHSVENPGNATSHQHSKVERITKDKGDSKRQTASPRSDCNQS